MNIPVDYYPTLPLSKVQAQPIGLAKYNEPVFRRGEFQNEYVEVEVTVYDQIVRHPVTNVDMRVTRFGQMDVARLIDLKQLYDYVPFKGK